LSNKVSGFGMCSADSAVSYDIAWPSHWMTMLFCFRGGSRGPMFPPRPGGRPFPPDEDDFPSRGPPFGNYSVQFVCFPWL